jgi:hypothetical protein
MVSEMAEKLSIETTCEHVSNILSFIWFICGFFMYSGSNPFISIIIALFAANTSWIYLFRCSSVDKRWIFYSLGIDPDTSQNPVAASITLPPEAALRMPLMLALFPKIASSLTEGLCLLMTIFGIWAVNYVFTKILGMYIYLDAQIKNGNDNETITTDGFLYKKLSKLGHSQNSSVYIRIAAILMFVLVSIPLTLAQAALPVVTLSFCFVVWLNFILLATSLSKRFIVNNILFYTFSINFPINFSTNFSINEHTKKDFEAMISHQFELMKLEIAALFFIYILAGIFLWLQFRV